MTECKVFQSFSKILVWTDERKTVSLAIFCSKQSRNQYLKVSTLLYIHQWYQKIGTFYWFNNSLKVLYMDVFVIFYEFI